jgi:putative ATPase
MNHKNEPLASKLRPQKLQQFIGQRHILSPGKILNRIIESGRYPPLIFHGPPGCGKTTLGCIIAQRLNAKVYYLNAAFSNVAEVKRVLKEANKRRQQSQNTVLFIDEIHRFNKLQQEVLLPDTEGGNIVFIGATIYNPYYYLIDSLLSRSVSLKFVALSDAEIKIIIKQALTRLNREPAGNKIEITNKALTYIVNYAQGDARKALNSLEIGATTTPPGSKGQIVINLEVAQEIIQRNVSYDKQGRQHYDTISAFIKSIRGSDPDSALYWLAKMVTAGEDLRFVARRLIILASEDIGNANPQALTLAVSAYKGVEVVGEPESQIILAQTVTYLATSPKSNAAYQGLISAKQDLNQRKNIPVPEHLKTHSKKYKYPHQHNFIEGVGGYVPQDYGAPAKYYFPREVAAEKRIKRFLKLIGK